MKLLKLKKSTLFVPEFFPVVCFLAVLITNPLRAQNTSIYLDSSQPVETRVGDLLSRMTLDEKIGQMVQADLCCVTNRADIQTLGFGSTLSGGDYKAPGVNSAQKSLNN